MEKVPTQKSSAKFLCERCDYSTSRNSQYQRHLATDRHKFLHNPTLTPVEYNLKIYTCDCGKKYKHKSTLYAHKKLCKQPDNNV